MSDFEEITQQFSQLENVIERHGDKDLKKQSASFKLEIDRFRKQQENRARIEAELKAIPEKARNMATRGLEIDNLIPQMTALKAEFEISEMVSDTIQSNFQRAWAELQNAYSRWMTAEGERLENKAIEAFTKDAMPLFEFLRSNRQTLGEIEAEIRLIALPLPDHSNSLPAKVRGMKNMVEAITTLLAVKFNLPAEIEMPVRDTSPYSARYYSKLNQFLSLIIGGSAYIPSEFEEGVAKALAFILADSPETRKTIQLGGNFPGEKYFVKNR